MMRHYTTPEGSEDLGALSVEYQGIYGTAFRNLNITDLVNNPAANGVCRVLGLGFQEQPIDLFVRQPRPFLKDLTDPPLIRKQTL